MRRVLVLALTALLLTAAAACGSGSPKPAPTGINLVSVSGELGKKPTVSFPKPFKTTKTESKVVKPGKGAKVTEGQQVVVDYVGVNGRDKKEFDSSWKQGQPVTFGLVKGKLINGFISGLVGKSVGDRVLVTIPPKDGYGPQGAKDAGIKGTDTLVFVIDIKDAYKLPSQASGEKVSAPSGLPTVKSNPKGIPTAITVPKSAAPKKLVAQPLIRGKGPKVSAKSTVTFHYLAANWRSGKTFDSSWATGNYVSLPLSQTPVKGLSEGLMGQPVGSRVLLVLPPDKGFGRDLPNTDVKKTDTVIFVVDILHAS